MKRATEQSAEVVNEIMNIISTFKIEGDPKQLKTSIHPVISNAMFHRENELLEQERLETLVTLSRTFDDENMRKAVKALRYQITLKPKR